MPLTPIQAVFVVGVSVETVFAQANFSNTITLGSIILGIVVLVVAALFTIRSNVAKIWREEAEGWKSSALHERELREKSVLDRARELDEERDVRHALKNELAATKADLAVEKAKPDLSLIVEQSKENYANAMRDITAMVTGIVETQNQMLDVLSRLAAQIERNGHPKETTP